MGDPQTLAQAIKQELERGWERAGNLPFNTQVITLHRVQVALNEAMASVSPDHEGQRLRGIVETALRLARQATNGWASYAKRAIEHREIARLHQEIDTLTADQQGET